MSTVTYNNDYSITVDGVTYSPEDIAEWVSTTPPEEVAAVLERTGIDPYMVTIAYNVATGSTVTPEQASGYLGMDVEPNYVSHVDVNGNLVVNGTVYSPIDVYNWVTNTPPNEVATTLYALGIDPADVVDVYNAVAYTPWSYAYAANYWGMPVGDYDPNGSTGGGGSGSSGGGSGATVTIPTDQYPSSTSQSSQSSSSAAGIDWSVPVAAAAEQVMLGMIPAAPSVYNNYVTASDQLLYGNNSSPTSRPPAPPQKAPYSGNVLPATGADRPVMENNPLLPYPPILTVPYSRPHFGEQSYYKPPYVWPFKELRRHLDLDIFDYRPTFDAVGKWGTFTWTKENES